MFCPDPERGKELVRRIQAGDHSSEEEFVRIFYPHILAMAAGRLRDLENAREITQETLLGVLQALREGRLREGEKLAAFVIGTARNLLNNHIQKLVRKPPEAFLDLDRVLIPGENALIRRSADEEEERRTIAGQSLKKLKPTDRRILFLSLAEGLTSREIAAELGMKPENVRNRKSRALRAVQRRVKKMIRNRRLEHN